MPNVYDKVQRENLISVTIKSEFPVNLVFVILIFASSIHVKYVFRFKIIWTLFFLIVTLLYLD